MMRKSLSRIGDYISLTRGVSYKKEQAIIVKSNGFTALFRANNIENNSLTFDNLVYVPSNLVNSDQLVNQNDIVISMSSGSKSQVGKVAIARDNTDLAIGAFCAKITPIGINPRYLFYYLCSSRFRKHIEQQSKGTNINNIKQSYITEFEIPTPNIDEQRRIVARIEDLFSELDNSVSTLQKTKSLLGVYRQATISNAYPKMTLTNTKKLMDIADIVGGITKGRDLTGFDTISLPYLRVANVQNGYLNLSEIKEILLKAEEKDKYILHKGDVLYTEGGDRDKLGRGTVWNEQIPDCVHQNHIFRARIDSNLALPEYVAFWSMGSYARQYFFNKGKQTVNLASINKTVLSNLKLPIPDMDTQRRTVNEIESRLSICDSIEHTVNTALQQAAAMRQSILKQAFEGRL